MLEFKGRFKDIVRDYFEDCYYITFSVQQDVTDYVDSIKSKLLNIKVAENRKKRSLNANSYFHVLNGLLAESQNVSANYMKNYLISQYGQRLIIDNTPIVIKTNMSTAAILERSELHTWPINGGDSDANFYAVFRGTHTYDSKEFSRLLEGTVYECDLQGIQRLPSEEIESLVREWEKVHA